MAMVNNTRLNIVIIVVFLVGGIVLSRLFYLQIKEGNYYKAMAEGQQNSISEVEGARGQVYFKNGELLATDEDEPYLFISPEEITDKDKTAYDISQTVGIDKDTILNLMAKAGSYYEVIKYNLSKDETDKINNLDLKGAYIGYKTKRYYPQNETACQLIGFINEDGVGQYGIEGYYNDILKGKTALQKQEKNPWGFLFSLTTNDSMDGASLTTTIDYNIQFEAEKLLQDGVEKYGAEGGQIIVMDPSTGEIIAMAQYPNFDPNNYQVAKMEDFQNSAVEKLFEPGSIFKPITMSAAVNENAVAPDTVFDDKLGYAQFGTYKVYNYTDKAWGKVTMTQVLQDSINTGVMFAEQKMGDDKFINYLDKYGFFEDTGVDLSGEVYSENNEIKKAYNNRNSEVTFGTTAFGQGIAMTPLQMVRSFSAIINGGKLMKPYIVKEIDKGGTKQEIQPQVIRDNIISAETSLKLKNMMINVVESGFGNLAKIPGYYIGGKTGTAQVPYTSLGINKSGYSDHTWQTFMGFAPALDPKFIALVKLDNPTKTKTSEYSAVPIFHDLAKYIFDYWQIPPDYDASQPLDKK